MDSFQALNYVEVDATQDLTSFPVIPTNHGADYVDFRPWIDQTPITLSPTLPVEIVLEIFKKMGLRYALISNHGRLCGIVTKKDLLRHLATLK